MKKALMIIDMQKDFMPEGKLPIPDGDAIVPKIKEAIERNEYDHIVFTADWHPENHSSFKENGGDWPKHCVAGTDGASIHSSLVEYIDESAIIAKKAENPEIDAFSAFYDVEGNFLGLGDKLRNLGIEYLDIVGVATEYCVLANTIDAIEEGFGVTVLIDAVAGLDKHEEALYDMEEIGAIVK